MTIYAWKLFARCTAFFFLHRRANGRTRVRSNKKHEGMEIGSRDTTCQGTLPILPHTRTTDTPAERTRMVKLETEGMGKMMTRGVVTIPVEPWQLGSLVVWI